MSAYRDQFTRCPSCAGELVAARSTLVCPGCQGAWVGDRVLTEMIWEMHDGAETLPPAWSRREPGPARACPVCKTALDPVWLEGVPLDRCRAGHGVWLDADELAQTLHNASQRPPRSVGVKVDLRPIQAERESDRRDRLHGWLLETVNALDRR
ncbi:MAG: zf-TFIIB domain-containing protein [Kofleriaceae bacterium]|nr:zf-TFIIB domain-containing protein [Kofleriaceae bacterium]MCL4228566.1 zf-TFIIB domain-containing protein [Myxococcales bacterium]